MHANTDQRSKTNLNCASRPRGEKREFTSKAKKCKLTLRPDLLLSAYSLRNKTQGTNKKVPPPRVSFHAASCKKPKSPDRVARHNNRSLSETDNSRAAKQMTVTTSLGNKSTVVSQHCFFPDSSMDSLTVHSHSRQRGENGSTGMTALVNLVQEDES